MMGSKAVVLIIAAGVCMLLMFFHNRAQRLVDSYKPATEVPSFALPYEWAGNICQTPIAEPSGITFHTIRKTIFVVSDEGELHEMRRDGRPVRSQSLKHTDLEGITMNPSTGLLYAVVEGDDAILEISPQSFEITRRFGINRGFEGRELLKKGGMGLEAITFVPNDSHPEGGTFWVGNQSFSLKPNREPSIVCEVVVPLSSTDPTPPEGKIISFFPLSIIDISGLTYDSSRHCLIVVSDTTNLLVEVVRDGTVLRQHLLPGNDQEGIALDQEGFMYIAQENGEVIKIEDRRVQ
jgi:uncharacterized protein YjiK